MFEVHLKNVDFSQLFKISANNTKTNKTLTDKFVANQVSKRTTTHRTTCLNCRDNKTMHRVASQYVSYIITFNTFGSVFKAMNHQQTITKITCLAF